MGSFAGQVGGNFAKIAFQGDLFDNLGRGAEKIKEAIFIMLEVEAPRLEAQMKVGAPWADQTGNARNGLATRAYRSGDELGILLYHQVPYGIWLELANDSRYAIIIPTLANESDAVLAKATGIMEKMRF